MTEFARSKRVRRLLAPALAFAGIALSTQVAFAIGDGRAEQPKPSLNVETERSPQGARLTFKGKGWGPAARVKITATRAPNASAAQDFGIISADSAGVFQVRKTAPCSTNNADDTREQVTFTAADSATGVKVTAKVESGAWLCQ